MINSLSNLNLSYPGMRSKTFLTVFALLVLYFKFYYKALLKQSIVQNFFLHSNLDFDSSWMRLSPNKGRVNQFYSLKSLYLL